MVSLKSGELVSYKKFKIISKAYILRRLLLPDTTYSGKKAFERLKKYLVSYVRGHYIYNIKIFNIR